MFTDSVEATAGAGAGAGSAAGVRNGTSSCIDAESACMLTDTANAHFRSLEKLHALALQTELALGAQQQLAKYLEEEFT